ncbi:hypothetical protein CLTEP_12850 [Clostridium tepidiprofundi DSM 19306]|uniref:N-acetylneuraminate synthase n=1 Tax=Clostridium tepidiprofundi DSM 19306 TaxID=1121338 RepID=A0A151B4U5_9CLOT|nr:hypothetical protein [Clostridium tepidiprofundi]KYH34820.1 hypothetical protein CLTEP_12850 [Clostridium tepidiprofundi DSM 19306]
MKNIRVGNYTIGDNNPCFIIAEAGSNHNGNIEKANCILIWDFQVRGEYSEKCNFYWSR